MTTSVISFTLEKEYYIKLEDICRIKGTNKSKFINEHMKILLDREAENA